MGCATRRDDGLPGGKPLTRETPTREGEAGGGAPSSDGLPGVVLAPGDEHRAARGVQLRQQIFRQRPCAGFFKGVGGGQLGAVGGGRGRNEVMRPLCDVLLADGLMFIKRSMGVLIHGLTFIKCLLMSANSICAPEE